MFSIADGPLAKVTVKVYAKITTLCMDTGSFNAHKEAMSDETFTAVLSQYRMRFSINFVLSSN